MRKREGTEKLRYLLQVTQPINCREGSNLFFLIPEPEPVVSFHIALLLIDLHLFPEPFVRKLLKQVLSMSCREILIRV